jgi:hypothetical protein
MATKITGTVSGEPIIEYEVGGVFVPLRVQTLLSVDEGASSGCTFGDLTNPDGDGINYRIASFTSTSGGSLVVAQSGIAQVLLIGGGGGAGWTQTGSGAAGGGGAGGVVETDLFIPAGTYSVTVGAKGSNGGSGNRSYAGGSSSIGNLIAAAGGGAGAGTSGSGSAGASGGGGDNRDRDTFVVGQGYAGRGGVYINGPCGGGSGGPGYAGVDPGEDGGNWTRGGPGRSSSLTGSTVTYARGGTGGNVTGGPGVWPDPVAYGDGGNANYGGGSFPSKQGGDGAVFIRWEVRA